MNTVHLFAAVVLFAAGASPVAAAEPRPAAATVITGELGAVERAEYVVNSAVVAGETFYLVLADAAGAAELVLRVPKAALRDASLALGQSVTLAADGLGWLVQSAGRSVAFIPPEAAGLLR